jgi:hypothetical protein
VDPENGNWPLDISQAVLTIGLSPEDRERMNALAAKAQEGELTCDEELQLESYRRACRLLEWMKAKARISITRSSAPVSQLLEVE